MHHRSLALAAISAALVAAPAFAQDSGLYLQANLGAGVAGKTELDATLVGQGSASTDGDLDAGLFASVAFGKVFAGGLSVEGEILYLKNDIDTGDLDRALGTPLNASVRSQGVMLNAFYNVGSPDSVSARFGAGLGYGQSRYKMLGDSDTGDGLMWQAMVSAAYPISETLALDVGYRYVRAPEYEVSDPSGRLSAETGAHVLSVGTRFSF